MMRFTGTVVHSFLVHSLWVPSEEYQRISLKLAQAREIVVDDGAEDVVIGRLFVLIIRKRRKPDLPH